MKKKLFFLLLVLCLLLPACGLYTEWNQSSVGKTKADSLLEVHYIDVGQGDCTLLLCGGEAMLIDAGDNDQGSKIQSYLKSQGVTKLKYMVGTHPDADHIGGMDVILYQFDCDTVLMPEEKKDTNTYRDVIDTMKNKGYKNTLPIVGTQYSLGDATFTILSPSKEYDDSNDNSIVIRLVYGENSFLFTGDAQEEAEEEMLESGYTLKSDVYKAGHHGSKSSSSEAFMKAVAPEYAIISCGEENSYGHPHAATLNTFRAMGINLYRTDEQGTIVAKSDGKTITFNGAPSDSWKAGEPTGQGDRKTEDKTKETQEKEKIQWFEKSADYICNTNTMKFHNPDCGSVKQIKEENKLEWTGDRETLTEQGYAPCQICNP